MPEPSSLSKLADMKRRIRERPFNKHPIGPPMTLGNMREQGVRSLSAYCNRHSCMHNATVDVAAFPDDVLVISFGPRMVCSQCGSKNVHARPNWKETHAFGMGRRESDVEHEQSPTEDHR